VGAVFGLSYLFGEQVAGWVKHAEARATIVVLLIVILIGSIAYYRHRERVMEFVFGRETPPAES
jgi:membrane protein DedA with SNARE-associated domain